MMKIKTQPIGQPLWRITGTIARIEAEIQAILDDETLTPEQRDTCVSEAFGAYEDAQEALPEKVENCARYIKTLEYNRDVIKKEKQRIDAIQKSNEYRIERFRRYLLSCLKQIDGGKFRAQTIQTYFYTKKESKLICDQDKLPPDPRFWTPQKPKMSAKGVIEAIKDGEEIPGASLADTDVLVIK